MISTYREVLKQEPVDFEDYLRKIHIYSLFESIFEEFGDNVEIVIGIIKFIFYSYSTESEMLHESGRDWSKLSNIIFDKCGLPEEMKEAITTLSNLSVQESIEKFLQYQNDEEWTEYCHYRDLRKQMLSLSVSDLKNSSGEIDIKAKMEAAINSGKLLVLMKETKDRFIEKEAKLKRPLEAFEKAKVNTEKKSKFYEEKLKTAYGRSSN